MKVFISWSGSPSREVAMALHDWLPLVIQVVVPYVSSEDIDPGARWNADIASQLDNTDFGILCVTQANATAPWLNFEAGAISKSVERSRVVPFLFGLSPSDIPTGPLVQFQAVKANWDGVLRLVRAMNEWCKAFPPERLEEIARVWWPKLEEKLSSIQQQSQIAQPTKPQRSTSDMLAELLELTRGMQRELQDSHVSAMPRQRLAAAELSIYSFMNRVVDLSLSRGFHATHRVQRPADLLFKRDDLKIYGILLRNFSQSRRILGRIREQLHHLPGERVLVVLVGGPRGPFVDAAVQEEYGPNVRVVHWLNPIDDDLVLIALDDLSAPRDAESS